MSYVEPSLSRTADLAGQTAPPSLALTTRLTGFFFLASLLLVAICSGILYAAVIEALRQADNQVVEKRMTAILEILETKELNEGLVAHEVDEDNQGPRQIFIRVVTDFNPLALETPSMTERLPTSLFPDVTKAPLKVPQHKTLVNASGATYESLAVRVPVTAKPGPDEAIIQVATDTSLDKESMMLFRRVLFYMLNAAVPLCALVASWLVRRELAPLSRISKAAATIDGESLDTRLALNGLPTELHTLAMQFNHMLARLEATCDGLKQYADNIAHELRTPINRMRLDGNTKPGNSERLGLGLAITKSIVVLHGGTIAVESARGVGTKYTMTFPDHPEVPGLTFRSLDYETFPRRDLRDDEGAAKAAQ